jgi:predicted nucleotidyltransferase
VKGEAAMGNDAELNTVIIDKKIAEAAKIKLAPKTTPITKEEALIIGKKFAERVRNELDNNAMIFVFGSTIKGEADLNSDIDIAVVSKEYGDDVMKGCVLLGRIADDISWDIEVHTVAQTDWINENLHTFEIKKWGVAV